MNEKRTEAVRQAFDKLDINGNGVLELDDIAQVYNVRGHPDVKTGRMTADQVLREFLDNFDAGVKDGKVPLLNSFACACPLLTAAGTSPSSGPL